MDKLDLFENYFTVGMNPIKTSDVRFVDDCHVLINGECVISFLSFGADSENIEIPITLHSASIALASSNHVIRGLQLSFTEGGETKTLTAGTIETIYANIEITARVAEGANRASIFEALDAATYSIVVTANDLDLSITFSSSLKFCRSIPALIFLEATREPPRHDVKN